MRTIDESFQSMISKRYGVDFSNLKANKQASLQEALNEAEEADAKVDYGASNSYYDNLTDDQKSMVDRHEKLHKMIDHKINDRNKPQDNFFRINDILDKANRSPIKVNVMFITQPGIGVSSIVQSWANNKGYDLVKFNGKANFDDNTVLLIDEADRLSADSVNRILNGTYKFAIAVTTNGNRIDSALQNRFYVCNLVNTNESLNESNLNEWTANNWTAYSKDGKSYKDFNKAEDFLSFINKYSDKIGKVSSNECQPIDLQKFWSYTDMQRGELFNITPQQYGHYFPDKSITNYGKAQLKNQYESLKSAKKLIRVNRNDSLKESHNPSLKSVKKLMGFNEDSQLNEMVDNINEIGNGRVYVPNRDKKGMIYSKQFSDCRDIKPAKIFEDTDEDLEGSIEFDPKASNNEYIGKTLKAASDISYCRVDEWEDEDHSMSDLNKCGLRKDNDYIVIPKGTQMKYIGKPGGYSRFQFDCGMTLDFDGDKFNLSAGNTIDEGIKDTFNRIGQKLGRNMSNDMNDDQLDSWLVFDFANRDYDVIPMDKAPNGNNDVKQYCKAKGIKCDKIVPCKKNRASQIAQWELNRHFQNAKQNVDRFNAQQDREAKEQNRGNLNIRGSFSQREKDAASIERERALYNQKKLGN